MTFRTFFSAILNGIVTFTFWRSLFSAVESAWPVESPLFQEMPSKAVGRVESNLAIFINKRNTETSSTTMTTTTYKGHSFLSKKRITEFHIGRNRVFHLFFLVKWICIRLCTAPAVDWNSIFVWTFPPFLPSFTEFYLVLTNFTEYYLVLLSFTEFYQYYRVLPSFTWFYRVLPGFTEFYRVLPSFIEFYRVLSSFTKFYLVLPSFTEFYRVLPSFTEFYRVLPSFTEFYRVLPSFT